MSLFIAALSFPGDVLLAEAAKVGVLGGSLLAALVGVVLLVLGTSRQREPVDAADG